MWTPQDYQSAICSFYRWGNWCPADESDIPKSTRLDSISVSGLQCRGSLLLSGSFLAIWNGSEGACKGARPGRGWHASFRTKCPWHHERYAMCQGWVRLTDFLNHEANSTWLCDLGLWSLMAGLLPSRPWVLFFLWYLMDIFVLYPDPSLQVWENTVAILTIYLSQHEPLKKKSTQCGSLWK